MFGNSTAVNNHASSLLRSLCLSFSLSLPPVRSVVPITISIILDLEFPNLVKKILSCLFVSRRLALGFASAFNWSIQVSQSFVFICTLFLVTSFLAEIKLGFCFWTMRLGKVFGCVICFSFSSFKWWVFDLLASSLVCTIKKQDTGFNFSNPVSANIERILNEQKNTLLWNSNQEVSFVFQLLFHIHRNSIFPTTLQSHHMHCFIASLCPPQEPCQR